MKPALLLALLLPLAACQTAREQQLAPQAPVYEMSRQEQAVAIAAVKSALRDPYRSRVTHAVGYGYGPEFVQVCGIVNPVNGFGGHVGEVVYYLVLRNGQLAAGPIIDRPRHSSPASDRCVQVQRGARL